MVCEYPIGHKRRRKEGMPVLVEKFKTNLARSFPARQQKKILDLCQDAKKLAATPVNEFELAKIGSRPSKAFRVRFLIWW